MLLGEFFARFCSVMQLECKHAKSAIWPSACTSDPVILGCMLGQGSFTGSKEPVREDPLIIHRVCTAVRTGGMLRCCFHKVCPTSLLVYRVSICCSHRRLCVATDGAEMQLFIKRFKGCDQKR